MAPEAETEGNGVGEEWIRDDERGAARRVGDGKWTMCMEGTDNDGREVNAKESGRK